MQRHTLRSLLVALIFTAGAAAAALYLHRPPAPLGGLLWRMELASYDLRLAQQNARQPDNIVIVAIDDESLQQRAEWPWPRAVHADLIDRLSAAGARLIGMDILFDSPSGDDESDAALARAVKQSGRVILAGQINRDTATRGEATASSVTSASFPCEPFDECMLAMGLTNIHRDPDSVVRRAWLEIMHQDEPYYTLPVVLAAAYLKRPPAEVAAEGLALGQSTHPYLGDNTVLNNFCGPAGQIKTVPYYQVLEDLIPPETFRDKIVLVGGTAEILQDIYPTPMPRREPGADDGAARLVPMPGVEVQANAVATLLSRLYLRPVPLVMLWGVALLAALLVSLATVFWRPLRAALVTLLVLALVVVAAFLLLWQERLWLPLVPLLLGTTLAYVEGTVYMYFAEERARLRMRRAWGQRVSAEVLKVILDNPVPKVQGRKIDATVMFSDLRGFTTMCSTSPPEYVVERLNEYLTAMTQVIREFGGTIHKFIGDGIMAVFGDPVPQADHAERAVRASMAMQRRMIALNQSAQERGMPLMYMGIGIHTGELVAGDIGSEQLLEYTVIGDTVSTASRIEGLNKECKTGILISGQTVAELGEVDLPLRQVGTHGVRGRAEALELYTVELPGIQLPFQLTQEKDGS